MTRDHDIAIPSAREKSLPVVGPVSRAIAIMRAAEPSPLAFVPAHAAPLSKGFYIGRKKAWRPEASWTFVMVMPDEDVPGRLNVHEVGTSRVDDPSEWLFRDRVAGVDELPRPVVLNA